jgi:hypothetical protein
MKKKFLKIVAVLTIGALMVSCLDDEKYALDPAGSHNVIEFLDPSVPVSPTGSIYPVYLSAFTLAPEAQSNQTISYSGAHGNDRDIELTLAVDPIALADYNEQMEELHGPTFELLPEANYSIPTTVIIPAGQTKVNVSITVYPQQFDLAKTYALPLRIVSASHGILSAHFSVAVLGMAIKNKYDGEYAANIQLAGWGAYGISGVAEDYPDNIGLVTAGPKSVSIANYLRGDNLLPGFSANTDGSTSATGFGAASPVFTFDDNDKLINVDNAIADDGRGRDFVLNPAATAEENLYNPATKTFIANFLFKQNSRPDAVCKWTLVFDRDR